MVLDRLFSYFQNKSNPPSFVPLKEIFYTLNIFFDVLAFYLSVEDVLILAQLDKRIANALMTSNAAHDFWQKKFRQHFPHLKRDFTKCHGYEIFKTDYQDEYACIKAYKFSCINSWFNKTIILPARTIRQLYSYVKENDAHRFIELINLLKLPPNLLISRLLDDTFSYPTVDRSDIYNRNLLYWISKKANPALLDFVFENAMIVYENDNSVLAKELLFYFSIKTHRTKEVIANFVSQGHNVSARHFRSYSNYFTADLKLISYENIRIITPSVLLKANQTKTPILFKIKKSAYVYGCVDRWKITEIPLPELIYEWPFLEENFQKGFVFRTTFTPEIINILKRAHHFSPKTKFECTTLHLAVIENQLEIVRQLVQKDRQLINSVDYFKRTPLYLAVKYAHKEIVDYLINQGANTINCMPPPSTVLLDKIPFPLENCSTILALACKVGKLDIVKLILEKTSHSESQVIRSFITAVHYGRFNIIEFFLERQPKLLGQGYYPHFASLSVAISQGHEHIINYFFAKRADLLTMDHLFYNNADQIKKIESIIPMAIEAKQNKVIDYLKKNEPILFKLHENKANDTISLSKK